MSARCSHSPAGAIDAGSAVALALTHAQDVAYPAVSDLALGSRLRFVLHEPEARDVKIVGSWDDWSAAGTSAVRITPGLWHVTIPALASGSYAYKFVVDGTRWIEDQTNRVGESDGFGATNSAFVVRPSS